MYLINEVVSLFICLINQIIPILHVALNEEHLHELRLHTTVFP